MAIQNARQRAKLKKEQMMEQQVEAVHSDNGVEKSAPLFDNGDKQQPPKKDSLPISALVERREKMMQGLNSVKAEREAIVQRLKDLDTSVARTEGAVITIDGLIAEIDPQMAKQMMGG